MIAGLAIAVMVVAFVVVLAPRGGAVGPGTVEFASAAASVTETDDTSQAVQLTVQRTVGTDGAATVDFAVFGGSATAADYDSAGTSGTLTWPAGDSTPQLITIMVLGDNDVETDETVDVVLANATGASLGAVTTATITITDDDNTIAFTSVSYSGAEVDGTTPLATVTVARSAPGVGSATVQYSSSDGTAGAGDYSGGDGTLVWAPGETTQTFTVAITDDSVVEPTETVQLVLSNPVGAALGAPSTATLSIADDEDAGTVQFSSPEYAVVEDEPAFVVTVTRAGGSDGEVTVTHSASDGTATASDYTGGDGTLTWDHGDISPRTFTVGIDDDSASEPDETVLLALTNPLGGLELGSPSTATLKIVDDAGGSGDDRFVIRTSQPGGLSVNGRNGSDVYRVELGGLLGPVSAFDSGSSGFDTVEIVAPEGGDDLQLRVFGDVVVFTRGADTVNMRGIEALVLDARGGIDTVSVDTNGTTATSGFSSFQFASLRVSVFSHETMRFSGSATGSRGFSTGGYWTVDTNGGVYAFGTSRFFGSTGGARLNQGVVDLAATPSGNGYWLVAADGGIFSFGDARFLGSTGSVRLNRPIIGMTPTPSGNGYWLVATDGGIFSFGDARFFGSTGGITLNRPIVGMAATPTGNGYWLVAADGGIFAFGDAPFFGSTGGVRLNRPIVGISPSPSGHGYWMVATDGGIFAFGNARFLGSTGGIALRSPVMRMIATPSGNGYWMVGGDGGIFSFGDAAFSGSAAGLARAPVVDIDAMTLP
jgi:hypothetical protein